MVVRARIQSLAAACLLIVPMQSAKIQADSLRVTTPLQPGAIANQATQLPGLVQYLAFLQQETRAHRELVESFYTRLQWVLGGGVVGIFGLLVWVILRSKKEIKKIAESETRPYITDLLDRESKIIKEARNATSELLVDMKSANVEINEALLKLKGEMEVVKAAEYLRGKKGLLDKAVLWVDDNPRNVEFPHKVLANAGIFVERTGSTAGALNCLCKDRFHVMVTNMAREGNERAGLDLIRQVNSQELHIPVVVFTRAIRIVQYGKEIEAEGAFLACDYATLLRRIADILAPHSPPQESPELASSASPTPVVTGSK